MFNPAAPRIAGIISHKSLSTILIAVFRFGILRPLTVTQHGNLLAIYLIMSTTKMYLKPHLLVVNHQNLTRSRTRRCAMEWFM
jgi:hypothetical protein